MTGQPNLIGGVPPPLMAKAGRHGDYLALPNAANPRWIFPAARACHNAALTLYAPQKPLGKVRKLLMRRGLLSGQTVMITGVDELKAILASAVGASGVELAFSLGTPGAYRKTTVLAMSPGGQALAFAKIAYNQLAQRALAHESTALERLSGNESMSGRVPRLLLTTRWEGALVAVITAGPSEEGPRKLGKYHGEFLGLLRKSFGTIKPFRTSGLWQWMDGIFSFMSPSLPGPTAARIERGLHSLDQLIGRVAIPLTLAHGDFTPWNSRVAPDGSLYVFDWEQAREDCTTSFDAFHFTAMQEAVRRKRPVSPQTILAKVQPIFPGNGSDQLRSEYLVYLLATTLFYAHALLIAPGVGNSDVLVWMESQLDRLLRS